MSLRQAGGRSRLSGAVLLPQGPRLGGIPPPRARGCGGETPRPPQPRAASAFPGSGPPPARLRALRLLRRSGPPRAGQGEETMEVVPALERAEKPTVNASGSPPMLRAGGREEETNFPAGENHPDSQPGGEAFRCPGSRGETPGTFPGIYSPREGQPVGSHWLP